ncbi:MAG: phage major capsid protein, partial [Tepidisphaeraceae bacterium]
MDPEKLKAQIAENLKKARAIADAAKAENREVSDDEAAQIDKLASEVRDWRAQVNKAQQRAATTAELQEAEEWMRETPARRTPATSQQPRDPEKDREKPVRRGQTRFITGERSADRAHRMGMMIRALRNQHTHDDPRAAQWMRDNGLRFVSNPEDGSPQLYSDHNENEDDRGGVLVFPELDTEIVSLIHLYGVFRQFARNVPMGTMERYRNIRTGGLTAYFRGEQSAATKSKKSWNQFKLLAKSVDCLAVCSNEVSDDATINLGDDFAGEMAIAFAKLEDTCGFNGEGKSATGGINGIGPRLLGLNATIANIAGLTVASGNLFSEFTLTDFISVLGNLPDFADGPGLRWFCHRTFWAQVMCRLMKNFAGNSEADLEVALRMGFLGIPVVHVSVMPRVDANSQIACLLGDLRMAADFGERRGMTIRMSNEATVGGVSLFETNQTAYLGTERIDINVHSVGNASATA